MMEQNARRLWRQSPEPNPEPGNEDGTACRKTRETIPGTLPETKRSEEMMMEQNARIPRTNPVEQNCFSNKPRNPSRNQERMMEQSARKVGRQAPEP